jgi:hypothetical protein
MLRWFCHLEKMDKRSLTKEIYEADLGGNTGRGRSRWTFLDQIGVLEKSQVNSGRNWRVYMKNLMKVEELKGVCKDRSKWKEYNKWETGVMLCMYVCMWLEDYYWNGNERKKNLYLGQQCKTIQKRRVNIAICLRCKINCSYTAMGSPPITSAGNSHS